MQSCPMDGEEETDELLHAPQASRVARRRANRCVHWAFIIVSFSMLIMVGVRSQQMLKQRSLQNVTRLYDDVSIHGPNCIGSHCKTNAYFTSKGCSQPKCTPSHSQCDERCGNCPGEGVVCKRNKDNTYLLQELASLNLHVDTPYRLELKPHFPEEKASDFQNNCLSAGYKPYRTVSGAIARPTMSKMTIMFWQLMTTPLATQNCQYGNQQVWELVVSKTCMQLREFTSRQCLVGKGNYHGDLYMYDCDASDDFQCWGLEPMSLGTDFRLISTLAECLNLRATEAWKNGLDDRFKTKQRGGHSDDCMVLHFVDQRDTRSLDAITIGGDINVKGKNCVGNHCEVTDNSQHNSIKNSPNSQVQSQYKECEGSSNAFSGSTVCCKARSGIVCCAAAASSADVASTSTDCPSHMAPQRH